MYSSDCFCTLLILLQVYSSDPTGLCTGASSETSCSFQVFHAISGPETWSCDKGRQMSSSFPLRLPATCLHVRVHSKKTFFFLMSTKTSFDFFVWELGNFDLTNLQNCVFWVLATAWVLKHGNQVLTCVTSGRKMKHTSATFTRQWAFLVGGRAM